MKEKEKGVHKISGINVHEQLHQILSCEAAPSCCDGCLQFHRELFKRCWSVRSCFFQQAPPNETMTCCFALASRAARRQQDDILCLCFPKPFHDVTRAVVKV